MLILTAILFKDKPPTPPSGTSEIVVELSDFIPSIKSLFKNTNMLILMMTYGQIVGIFNTMGTILGEIAPAYGYSVNESANLGAMFIVGGVIGCIPIGVYVGKT